MSWAGTCDLSICSPASYHYARLAFTIKDPITLIGFISLVLHMLEYMEVNEDLNACAYFSRDLTPESTSGLSRSLVSFSMGTLLAY